MVLHRSRFSFLASRFSLTRGTLAALTLLGLAGLPHTAQAQSLTTFFTGGNNNIVGGGVFFDLNVTAAGGITVTSLDTNVLTGAPVTSNLEVWTRSGTATGFQTAAAGWTLVSSGSGTTAAQNSPTSVDVSDFFLASGVTGVAIRNVNYAASYTNGADVFSNADLSLTAGSATNTFLVADTVFSPRTWNGTIFYTGGASSAPEPGTLALLALGIVGGVVARRRK
ncbi:PEP-CTERM sorting domain-containing protein [Armatimonas sp.]|uniref:PEP-CTERM sorting domain-containing protein n=1 Tax=Armatimonas sp. TaxID=1872638 RepID=UPI00374CDF52